VGVADYATTFVERPGCGPEVRSRRERYDKNDKVEPSYCETHVAVIITTDAKMIVTVIIAPTPGDRPELR
jgi:hypothetical protein